MAVVSGAFMGNNQFDDIGVSPQHVHITTWDSKSSPKEEAQKQLFETLYIMLK